MLILIGIVALLASFGVYMLWKTNERIRRDQEYVQSKILKTFVGPTGLIARDFTQITDACVTDWVTVDFVRVELNRLVDEGRVIREGDFDFGFTYWLPETAKGTAKTSDSQVTS